MKSREEVFEIFDTKLEELEEFLKQGANNDKEKEMYNEWVFDNIYFLERLFGHDDNLANKFKNTEYFYFKGFISYEESISRYERILEWGIEKVQEKKAKYMYIV